MGIILLRHLPPPSPTPSPQPPSPTPSLSPACQAYLKAKHLDTPNDLKNMLTQLSFPCTVDDDALKLFAPDPKPNFHGVTDTTILQALFGNPGIFGTGQAGEMNTCCGWRPHFNWVIATCEPSGGGTGQFCGCPDGKLPTECLNNAAQLNYVAAYQYDGSQFQLMDDSTCGDISDNGVQGNYSKKEGFERHKKDFLWRGGDWTTKYAPWRRQDKEGKGPRGGTPPGMLFVVSAENFYYAAFYLLNQLGLNTEPYQGDEKYKGLTNCWVWEDDPVEGSLGWIGCFKPDQSHAAAGRINQLVNSNAAQTSGVMPIAMYTMSQVNNRPDLGYFPRLFSDYCANHPNAQGCDLNQNIWWSGGAEGSTRFDQGWKQPYVFVHVIDTHGFWTYRFIPKEDGSTPWSGINRYSAARTLARRPAKLTGDRAFVQPAPPDVPATVQLLPALQPDAACARSIPELPDWNFASNAYGSMLWELYGKEVPEDLRGAYNFWTYFDDTQQLQGYPASIMGGPKPPVPDTCQIIQNVHDCPCTGAPAPPPSPSPSPAPPKGCSTLEGMADPLPYCPKDNGGYKFACAAPKDPAAQKPWICSIDKNFPTPDAQRSVCTSQGLTYCAWDLKS